MLQVRELAADGLTSRVEHPARGSRTVKGPSSPKWWLLFVVAERAGRRRPSCLLLQATAKKNTLNPRSKNREMLGVQPHEIIILKGVPNLLTWILDRLDSE